MSDSQGGRCADGSLTQKMKASAKRGAGRLTSKRLIRKGREKDIQKRLVNNPC